MQTPSNPSPPDPAELIRTIATHVPELSVKSMVAIVGSKASTVRQIGSGTLLAVADLRFVLTAAHVVREGSRLGLTLAISGGMSGNFTAVSGNWIISAGSGSGSEDDKYDVALYQLDDRQIARLGNAKFVRIADASFEADLSKGYFVVSGFPAMWSTVLGDTDDTMKSRVLQYGTYAFSGSTRALLNYDVNHHFLLEATPAQMLDHTGAPTSFRTRNGFSAQMPDDLRGVSGCSVWKVGDLSAQLETWSSVNARIVGVETGVYTARGAIKASRWNAVTTLLYRAFPATRSAIDLYAH